MRFFFLILVQQIFFLFFFTNSKNTLNKQNVSSLSQRPKDQFHKGEKTPQTTPRVNNFEKEGVYVSSNKISSQREK